MQVAGIELNNFIIMAIDTAGSADDGNTDNTVSKYKIKNVCVCIASTFMTASEAYILMIFIIDEVNGFEKKIFLILFFSSRKCIPNWKTNVRILILTDVLRTYNFWP